MSTISRPPFDTAARESNLWVGRAGLSRVAMRLPGGADVEDGTATQWLKTPSGRVEWGDLAARVKAVLRSNGMGHKPEPASPQPPPEVPPQPEPPPPGPAPERPPVPPPELPPEPERAPLPEQPPVEIPEPEASSVAAGGRCATRIVATMAARM
jgi:hypothetical protein